MFILEISECTDYGLAAILSILKRILNVVHIVVPIILIVSLTLSLIQLVIDPEDKNKQLKSGIKTKFLSAIIVFFLPFIAQFILNLIPMASTSGDTYTTFSLGSCYQDAERMQEIMDLAEKSTSSKIKSTKSKVSLFDNPDDYKFNATKPTGDVLLIAGHSYKPYCSSFPSDNDCKEETIDEMPSGYYEATETRELVKLIKKKLKSEGISADIANQLLGMDSKMNKSFYLEAKNNTEAFKTVASDLKRYKYVLEVHFNSSTSHNESGVSIVSSKSTTNIDNEIKEAVFKYTGKKATNQTENLYTMNYFSKLNIPMTYLKTEYYDNKTAMDNYSANKNKIAKEIATVIKNNYFKNTSSTPTSQPSTTNNNPNIIIGDSRTVGMCEQAYCNLCTNDKYIAKGSMGYSWFINTAIKETNTYLKNNSSKKYNIYILLGVNGLDKTEQTGTATATTYYNKITELATNNWKKHNIYFVSVNPVDSRTQYVNNLSINAFNKKMLESINAGKISNIKYCDTASKLTINEQTSFDGLHYYCGTYENIYNMLKSCK